MFPQRAVWMALLHESKIIRYDRRHPEKRDSAYPGPMFYFYFTGSRIFSLTYRKNSGTTAASFSQAKKAIRDPEKIINEITPAVSLDLDLDLKFEFCLNDYHANQDNHYTFLNLIPASLFCQK